MDSTRIGDVDQLAALIDRAAAERRLAEWEAERDVLERKIARQKALLQLFASDSAPPARPDDTPDQPPELESDTDAANGGRPANRMTGARIRALILREMQRDPSRDWAIDDLRSILAEVGVPLENAGATPLRRYLYDLRKAKEIVSVRAGVHRIAHPDDDAVDGRLKI